MADTTYYRFVVKRDTAANFTAANTVLLSGEFGLETDTRKLKIGDGVTAWTALAYVEKGLELKLLKDVDASAIADGLALVWNAASGKHVYKQAGYKYSAGNGIAIDYTTNPNLPSISSTVAAVALKGRVSTYASLPSTGNTAGDAYLVDADDLIYVWDGTAWPANGNGLSVTASSISKTTIVESQVVNGSTKPVTLTFSNTTQAGDIVLILGVGAWGASTPTGFTEVYSDRGSNVVFDGYAKVSPGGENSFSVTNTSSPTELQVFGVIIRGGTLLSASTATNHSATSTSPIVMVKPSSFVGVLKMLMVVGGRHDSTSMSPLTVTVGTILQTAYLTGRAFGLVEIDIADIQTMNYIISPNGLAKSGTFSVAGGAAYPMNICLAFN